MATNEEIGERLLDVLVQMWGPREERRTKLGMIASCTRQFETWWKFEIATAWEQHRVEAPPSWEDVWAWLEYHDRADVVIARPKEGTSEVCDLDGTAVIPLELKTTGTWWRQPNKALFGLRSDLDELLGKVNKARRAAPFGAVAILITHIEWDEPEPSWPKVADFEQLVEEALKVPEGVKPARNTLIHAGRIGTGRQTNRAANGTAMARQLIWTR